MSHITSASLLVAMLLLGGCGRSGTWTDDPKNWQRAFRSQKPDDVVVVHSKYWRSPHWTYEYEYFFHVEANDALHRQLLEQNDLVRVEGTNAVSTRLMPFSDRPEWFAPDTPERYEVWKYADDTQSDFTVFVEKDTKDLFLADKLL